MNLIELDYTRSNLNSSPSRFEQIKDKKKLERLYSINELIQTEKHFYNELKACYDCFMIIDFTDLQAPNPPSEFNQNILFEKVKPVIESSKKLNDLFDSELRLNENDLDKVKVGECLLKVTEEMKFIFAQYARHHDDIVFILKRFFYVKFFEKNKKILNLKKKDHMLISSSKNEDKYSH